MNTAPYSREYWSGAASSTNELFNRVDANIQVVGKEVVVSAIRTICPAQDVRG